MPPRCICSIEPRARRDHVCGAGRAMNRPPAEQDGTLLYNEAAVTRRRTMTKV
jgi:hypothetical protein